jgi:hypothetical protein
MGAIILDCYGFVCSAINGGDATGVSLLLNNLQNSDCIFLGN